MDRETYNNDEYKSDNIELYRRIWEMLAGIPGKWEFSQYTTFEHNGLKNYNVVYNDLNDEDRCFSIEWDNGDNPFAKAHIEVASD